MDKRKISYPIVGKHSMLTAENIYQVGLTTRSMDVYKFNVLKASCSVSNVECQIMEETDCQKSGLALIYKWEKMELRQRVCSSNQLYRQKLPPHATLISIVWSLQKNTNIQCSVWCTES